MKEKGKKKRKKITPHLSSPSDFASFNLPSGERQRSSLSLGGEG
jgi:hypothetical protein